MGEPRRNPEEPGRGEAHDPRRPHPGGDQGGHRHGGFRRRAHGLKLDRDLLLAACLLHDITKPLESRPDPGGAPSGGAASPAKKTEFGVKIQHGAYGAHKIWEKKLPKALELAHLVITHTRASNTRSHSYEAALLFYADWVDSDAGIVIGGGKPFAARWIEGE
ncbi:MAG: HD domain-containing protein [Candidatus Tectomicrobia bacterium]|nr:HD domain-containing protein [Candidatus Tectomicrobia bacterium]